jgi:hypothetical protein
MLPSISPAWIAAPRAIVKYGSTRERGTAPRVFSTSFFYVGDPSGPHHQEYDLQILRTKLCVPQGAQHGVPDGVYFFRHPTFKILPEDGLFHRNQLPVGLFLGR